MPFFRSAASRVGRSFLGLVAALAACAPIGCADAPSDETEASGEDALLFNGTPNEDIGQLFMIEHFGVAATGQPDVHDMLRKKNLGALILWNPTQATGDVVSQMAKSYARTAAQAGKDELFIAADQEEKGTQRFRGQHGFTGLVEGAALGRAVARNGGDPRVCELHGRITAREMAAAGMNMSLGTVSDVFTRNSGTPGMFRTRAIDGDASIVTKCIEAMVKGYAAEGHVVFVTKHFPGLGNASGNTDVDPSVRTYSDTTERMELELQPYRAATSTVNSGDGWPLFGAMISHASYRILDQSNLPATLSSSILTGLVRAPKTATSNAGVDKAGQPASFAGLELRGVTVSDAFWTWGATKNLSPRERYRLMARSVLAGMDVLMIAKSDFAGGWDYFQALAAGTLPAEDLAALAADAKLDAASLPRAFKERAAAAAATVRKAKAKVGKVEGYVKGGEPRATTTDLTAEYARLTTGS